jgi:two-component system sensor histidine kinase KdpD
VSHNLRTPLAAITGAASSLVEQDDLLKPSVRLELAKTIAEESEQLARLVSNLLDMTRLEGGNLRLQLVPHAIEDVVGAAFTVMERRMHGRGVRTQIPPDLPPVRVDGILIQEVLVNLIDNALKYSPVASELEVLASAIGGMVRVSVCDRGPGLAPDETERVFEKFYRGKAQGHTAGVGLGLAICKGIIEAHGGKILAENRDGGGAVFHVDLQPAAMPAAPAEKTKAPA